MLASLLPGVRHVRTPLITGLLYFLAVWLVVDVDRLTPSSDGSMAERHLRAAAELAGPTGVAAALALSALLVGSLLVIRRPPTLSWLKVNGQRVLFVGLWRVVARWPFISRLDGPEQRLSLPKPNRWDDLRSAVRARLASMPAVKRQQLEDAPLAPRLKSLIGQHLGRHPHDDLDWEEVEDAVLFSVAGELDLLMTRLQVERETLYNEIDRLRSEAELRYSIAPPLVAVFLTTSASWHPAFAVGVLVPVALVIQARRTDREARLKLITALQHRVVASPTLDSIEMIANPDHLGDK